MNACVCVCVCVLSSRLSTGEQLVLTSAQTRCRHCLGSVPGASGSSGSSEQIMALYTGLTVITGPP